MAIRKTHLIPLAAIALVAGALYFSAAPAPPMGKIRITAGPATLLAEVADTEEEHTRGLSGRDALPEGEGLLFIFEEEDTWGMWMKDMRFSIDILWADAEGTIITIAPEVAPQTYPEVFLPDAPARYVLELPAGYAKKAGIAEGDKIVVK